MPANPLTKARGTITILRQLPRQRRAHYLPREELRERRDARVRELVRYAAEHVPHYRELFRETGIDPRELRTAEDLESLPLLEKRHVQEDPHRFRGRSELAHDGLLMRTAGSTGMPLEVLWDRASLLANVAYAERERAVETHFCGARYRYTVAQVGNPVGNLFRVRDLYRRASFRPLRPRYHQLSIADSAETIVRQLNRIRPLALRGFGTHLELVFRTAAERSLELHRPRVVVYGTDHLSADGRRLIEERFGVPVLSRYSATEALRIAFSCEERKGLHLHEDLTHVRVLDANGANASPGERGEVVVTDLVNRGMVLINYRLGDLAALLPGPCACGRSTHRLSELEGRVRDIVELADGQTVNPHLLDNTIKKPGGVLRFQAVQHERDRFAVSLVTADQETYDRVAGAIADELRTLLHGAHVDVQRRTELGAEGSAKFRPVVALAPAARTPGDNRAG